MREVNLLEVEREKVRSHLRSVGASRWAAKRISRLFPNASYLHFCRFRKAVERMPKRERGELNALSEILSLKQVETPLDGMLHAAFLARNNEYLTKNALIDRHNLPAYKELVSRLTRREANLLAKVLSGTKTHPTKDIVKVLCDIVNTGKVPLGGMEALIKACERLGDYQHTSSALRSIHDWVKNTDSTDGKMQHAAEFLHPDSRADVPKQVGIACKNAGTHELHTALFARLKGLPPETARSVSGQIAEASKTAGKRTRWVVKTACRLSDPELKRFASSLDSLARDDANKTVFKSLVKASEKTGKPVEMFEAAALHLSKAKAKQVANRYAAASRREKLESKIRAQKQKPKQQTWESWLEFLKRKITG